MTINPGTVVIDAYGEATEASIGTLARMLFDSFIAHSPSNMLTGQQAVYWKQHAAHRANIHAAGFATAANAGVTAYLPPVDTLAAVSAIDASLLLDGAVVYCNEVEDFYVYELANAHNVDGIAVVVSNGDGVWVARQYGRWDDLRQDPRQAGGASALTSEGYADTLFEMLFMRHDQDDALSFAFQMPHEWDGSAVVPHLHPMPMATPAVSQNAYFEWEYCWCNVNEQVPALSGWTTGSGVLTVAPADPIRKHRIFSAGSVTPPANTRASAAFLWRIHRVGTSGSDTYTTSKPGAGTAAANLGLLFADVHYRKGSQGSETEVPS